MSEKFAFEKLFRNGGAINPDQRLVLARTATVDFARDQLFAGAGFALNQHGSVRRRDEINLTDELAQRAALTDQIAERTRFRDFLLQGMRCVVRAGPSDAGFLQTHAH